MAERGPIVVIEDDIDDREILAEVFRDLAVKNEVLFFVSCDEAYAYLKKTADKPFIIFSDINLPGMTGSDLKRRINVDEKLRRKCIPFIFLSTASEDELVLISYELLAQGYFVKPSNIAALKYMMEMILNYWHIARHPNPILL
ncbi:MAG: response regulator [Chitinophagaceae bacterium]|nr:MAG: response regulator [Chitinophagaceae bacterium]